MAKHSQIGTAELSNWSLKATDYALQYWIAGRYGVAAGFSPVSGNLMHHAIELLMKAAIAAKGHEVPIGHKLLPVFKEFLALYPDPTLPTFLPVIRALDRWEKIRYPDTLLAKGASLQISFESGHFNRRTGGTMPELPKYRLAVHDVDELVEALFKQMDLNPGFFSVLQRDHAATYHLHRNPNPLTPQGPVVDGGAAV